MTRIGRIFTDQRRGYFVLSEIAVASTVCRDSGQLTGRLLGFPFAILCVLCDLCVPINGRQVFRQPTLPEAVPSE